MTSTAPSPFVRGSRVSDDEGGYEVLIVALPEEPGERWAYRVEFKNNEPFFTHLHYSATQPGSTTAQRRATTFHPPVARLVGIWCVFHGLNIDGTPSDRNRNLWDGVMPGAVAGFSRAPDPRPFGGEGSADYADAMDNWTEPIADTLDLAETIGLSDVKAVELRFDVSRSVAKKHATRARRWNRRYQTTTPSPRSDRTADSVANNFGASPQDNPELWGTDPSTWGNVLPQKLPTRTPGRTVKAPEKRKGNQ